MSETVDLGKFAKTFDRTSGVHVKARFAIMEVLNHIIGWITNEWLWVDHKQGSRRDRKTFPA
jgi:hypothetical protein